REGLLAVAPGTGRFRWPHEVVRRAVRATMRDAEREELTVAVGRLLLAEPNADPHLVVELCGGTPTGSVADRAQLAGRALAAGRPAAAAAATRQALSLLGLDLPTEPARWRTAAGAATAALTRQLADVDVPEFARGLTATDPRAVLALEVIAEAVTLDRPDDDWS